MDEQQRRLAEELLFTEKKAPSFAKRLFFGRIDSSLIQPYPKDEDLSAFLNKVQHFIDTEIDPEWIDRHAEIPHSVIKGLGNLGILGLTIPKEYGGLGMSQQAYCRVAEAVSRKCGSTALFINAHQSIGLKALLLFGTKEQQQRWLKPLARGEQLAAFALTEPHAGSDAAGIETRATFDPLKNIYRINGKKQWITNGAIAHVLTVMAKTEVDTPEGKRDKITAFLVTPDMPGFNVVNPALEKVGMRGSKTANLEFNDMEVPANHILGPIGGGLRVCLTVLDYGRTTFGATCTGAAKFLVEKATHHARTRYQFKRPLASFALVKKKIAKMGALVYAMDATTYLTASLIDAGVEDIMLESAMLKVFSSEALWAILYDTMQIYGGRSFFTDHPFERMMRDARLNMIGEGSNEVLKAFIGAVGMRDVGVELKSIVDACKHPVKEFSFLWHSISNLASRAFLSEIPTTMTELQPIAKQIAKAIRKLGFSVVKLLKNYREEIIEKQLELERIANSAIAIYTSIAVLKKMESTLQNRSRENYQRDLSAGKLYCKMALEVVNRQLGAISSKQDRFLEEFSDQLTGVEMPW